MDSGKRFWFETCWLSVSLLSVCSSHPSQDMLLKEEATDVYDELWAASEDIAQMTLKLPFLEHMQSGDLQADDYVNFMIQDINYLLKVTDMLKEMSQKVKQEDIKKFMKNRFESYKKFGEMMLKQFNLKGVSEIKPIPAMEKYLSDYRTIMEKEEPIYFAVSLLPCSRLWLWLANQLKETYCNAYFIWKKNNMHGNPEKHYRNLLNANLKTNDQIQRAMEIFRQQMQNEHSFFAASLDE